MKVKVNHTPTPWAYSPNINVHAANDREIARTIVNCPDSPFYEAKWLEEAACNAEFIVRAVNSHEELLAACEDLLSDAEGYARTCGASDAAKRRIYGRCERARSAIAKAKKEDNHEGPH